MNMYAYDKVLSFQGFFFLLKNVCLVQNGSGIELTVLEGLWECQSETGTDQNLADDITSRVQFLGISKQVTVQ